LGLRLQNKSESAIVALDWPAVLEVTKENARIAGVAERVRLLPGSVFEADLGTDYDVVLLTNILQSLSTNQRVKDCCSASMRHCSPAAV